MKAKKIFLTALFVAIGILCVNSVKAEGDSPNSGNDRKTGTVTVNINLHAVQSLIINPTHDKVDIDYMNAADYKNGVSVEKTDHLIVFSTGGYTVGVSSDENFTAEDGTIIKAGDVTVTASAGKDNNKTFTPTTQPLGETTSSSTIIKSTSGTGVKDLYYTIKYDNTAKAVDNYKLLNTTNDTKKYTAQVTYTIASI